jgi:hypothetical protein
LEGQLLSKQPIHPKFDDKEILMMQSIFLSSEAVLFNRSLANSRLENEEKIKWNCHSTEIAWQAEGCSPDLKIIFG